MAMLTAIIIHALVFMVGLLLGMVLNAPEGEQIEGVGFRYTDSTQVFPSCHRGQSGRSNVDWRQPVAPGCKQGRGCRSQTRQMERPEAGIGQICAKGEQKARTPTNPAEPFTFGERAALAEFYRAADAREQFESECG